MRRLETHGLDSELPGFIIQRALFDTDYWLMKDNPEAAKETSVRALKHGHSPGVKSLRIKVEEKIRQIDSEEEEASRTQEPRLKISGGRKTKEDKDYERKITEDLCAILRSVTEIPEGKLQPWTT
ncbi:MAG: hypothetical protein ACFFD9_08570 [Candidatus Thorarchaeota archaeon]